ncbi:MAG TPA: hypothetical protein VKB52_05220 [Rhodanobacteraceae bacterium]|nr:hypothetical protein [Rhodanobacteraceae bacterium]
MRIRRLLVLAAVAFAAGSLHAQALPGSERDAPPIVELPPADISVTLDDGFDVVEPGQIVTWTLTVNNVGINGLSGVLLTTALSRNLSQIFWTCRASTGSQCTSNGSGAPNDSIVVASLGSVSYRMTATVRLDAVDTVSVSMSAAIPSGYIDLTPENNRATDTDFVGTHDDTIFVDGFDD